MERGGVNTIGKQHFTCLYCRAREIAFTKRNILAGWSSAGLFPFDPERVLRDMRRHCAESSTKTTIVELTRRVPDSPLRTPATPASAGALRSLHNRILTQHARLLDETSKRDLERHLEKFAKAAQALFARGALQQDQIRFLLKTNDEAKARRSAKSTILGKAKVMSFEDLVEVRTKRQEKDAAKEMKKNAKQGRKRKVADEETSTSQPKTKVVRLVDSPEYIERCVAPVARMW